MASLAFALGFDGHAGAAGDAPVVIGFPVDAANGLDDAWAVAIGGAAPIAADVALGAVSIDLAGAGGAIALRHAAARR